MRLIVNILLTIWMLPQNIIGAIVLLLNDTERNPWGWVIPGKTWGVSLGWFVFVGSKVKDIPLCIRHEQGHLKQSKILGPLYLFTVGVCSGLHSALKRNNKRPYHDFWTERWADRLAGIDRTLTQK